MYGYFIHFTDTYLSTTNTTTTTDWLRAAVCACVSAEVNDGERTQVHVKKQRQLSYDHTTMQAAYIVRRVPAGEE